MGKSTKLKFPETENSKVIATVGIRKFREANPRIDYYPMPDALGAIEWLRKRNPAVSTRELIDALLVAGRKSFSGNGQG